MAAQKQRKDEINLIPQKGFESSTAGRVLAWILSSFRIIVIITEIIVMIAFLSRFWLDAQNADLGEEIEHKRAVLEASVVFEKDFRLVQKKIAAYEEMLTQPKFSEMVKAVISSLPDEIILNTINAGEGQVTITGISPNEIHIQQFIVNLNSKDLIKGASLSQITSTENSSDILKFEIAAPYVKKEVINETNLEE